MSYIERDSQCQLPLYQTGQGSWRAECSQAQQLRFEVCPSGLLSRFLSLEIFPSCLSRMRLGWVESQVPSFFVRPYVVPYALFRGNRRLGKKPGERVLCVFSWIFSFSLSTNVIRGRDRRLERLERRVQSTAEWLRNSRALSFLNQNVERSASDRF